MSVRHTQFLSCQMFPLKLVRKTANGDLLLEGLPVYIAGSVAAKTELPVSGVAVGEGYIVGKDTFAVWIGKWIFYGNEGGEHCDCLPESTSSVTAIDAETINQTLLQTGFQAITKQ